ncbi:MAG TPA: lactaldehyde reductase [Candidatus Fimivicinus intestinavium]|nr:lactaldehyde reductase [Candidatus Fimivicinus intestinavium]
MAYRFILNETSYHGAGAIQEIVTEVKARGFQKALIVTDADLVRFGVVKKVTDLLEENHFAYEIFDKVKANPSVAVVQAGVEAFKQADADYMIAIGGGSPQDTAKGIGIIINNPEFADVVSLEGTAPTKHKSVPVIAVATTAGTAAETTINYVITDEEKRRKFVCVDPHDIPVVAVVDPEMMSSMPKGLTASTGMDALTHAIEGYTTLGAWELADTLNLKAIELIARSLRKAVANDPEGRRDMALGQYVTGMAFSNVGLGVVHGMAHPLSAFYDTPHGVANAVLLPYVMEFNAEYTGEKFREIARMMGVAGVDEMSQEEYRKAAIEAVRQLSIDVGIPQTLREIGVKEEDLDALADAAMADVCTGGNPRPCTKELVLGVYRTAFGA